MGSLLNAGGIISMLISGHLEPSSLVPVDSSSERAQRALSAAALADQPLWQSGGNSGVCSAFL